MSTREKLRKLTEILRIHAPLLIAYSGGVDSALLAVLAKEALGPDNMQGILVDGPEVPRRMFHAAVQLAGENELPLAVLTGIPFSDELKRKNPSDRCKYCKLGFFQILETARKKYHCNFIADGANASDTGENRPGIDAFSSCGAIHPFIMAGITKQDIRTISKEMGLSFWNKPSSACLYSRIPYGDEITEEKLRMIEKGEDILSDLGISQPRVRHHGTIARLEVPPDEMGIIFSARNTILEEFRGLGFLYVTMDLQGYRSGSMDEVLQ